MEMIGAKEWTRKNTDVSPISLQLNPILIPRNTQAKKMSG